LSLGVRLLSEMPQWEGWKSRCILRSALGVSQLVHTKSRVRVIAVANMRVNRCSGRLVSPDINNSMMRVTGA
jgi:hypothetical protein